MSYCDQADYSNYYVPLQQFCDQVFSTIWQGNLLKLRSLFARRNCKKEDFRKILESSEIQLRTHIGTETAPAIVIASKYGHHKIVHFLIKEFNVDIDASGNVKFDGFLIEGATALWCAAGAGHMEIVRCLVENGALVNKTTRSNSTPLRAACFDGRLDIVRYLVEHKADIGIPNKYKNNCLMISAFRGHLNVVQYLLQCGMDPNQRAMANATALQFAAETGRVEICRALVSAGAQLCENDAGLDQLFVAAEHAQAEVVMYLLMEQRLSVRRRHHVEALELLGAMMLNDKDKYDPINAFRLLRQALTMRNDREQPLPKQLLTPIAAYRYRKECETPEELDDLQYDFELLELEGLMIRERVLGQQYADLTGPIVYRGAVYADMMQFDRCLDLWMHALRIRSQQQQAAGKDLLRLTQVMSQMVSLGADVEFRVAYEVMGLCCQELHRSRLRCQQQPAESGATLDAYSQDVHTVLYLLTLLCKVKMTSEEEQLTYQLVHSLVRADFRLTNGYSLLHMACNPGTEVDNFHVNSVVEMPNTTVAKLLLLCGADPNCQSDSGDTSLHLIAMYDQALPDFQNLQRLVANLVNFGAHHDIRNCKGHTPIDAGVQAISQSDGNTGSDKIIRCVLSGLRQDRLVCLAAAAVARHRLPTQLLPPGLAAVVRLHGPAPQTNVGIGPAVAKAP